MLTLKVWKEERDRHMQLERILSRTEDGRRTCSKEETRLEIRAGGSSENSDFARMLQLYLEANSYCCS
jgi:hypothetical protein